MRRSCTLTPEQICGWACGLREQEHTFSGWNITLEQKISNPAQAHAGEVLLINHSHDICFFLINDHITIWCEIISVWDAHSEDAPLRIFNVTYMEVFSKASGRSRG